MLSSSETLLNYLYGIKSPLVTGNKTLLSPWSISPWYSYWFLFGAWNNVLQRQTEVTAHFTSKKLLLFVFAR